MKRLVLIFVLSSLSLWGVEFHSYEDALKLQKKNKKVIMIDVVRTDCHYCEDMQKNVLDDPEMSKYLSKKFISVKMDFDKQTLPLGIKVNFTPTFFFVDANNVVIKTVPGSWNIEDFTDLTKNIK